MERTAGAVFGAFRGRPKKRRVAKIRLGVMAVRGRNYPDRESRSDDWFAKELGAGWQASGDGIYEYVGERREAFESQRSLEVDDVDELPPARQSDEARESSPPHSAGSDGTSLSELQEEHLRDRYERKEHH